MDVSYPVLVEGLSPTAQTTGMAGVFYVAAELAKRDFVVAPTSRSARGPDILVASPMGRTYAIQVKTSRVKQNDWRLNEHVDEDVSPSLFYVFVILEGEDGSPDFFIVPSKIVSKERKLSKSPKFVPTLLRRKAEKFKGKWGQLK